MIATVRDATQADPAGRSFDVVIVGSGASGGWAAKRLTEAGLRVAVLEAGRQLTDADYKEHVPPFQLKYRGRTKRPMEREQPRQSASYAVREWNHDWFVNDIEEPYVDESDPAFLWVRTRVVGGRTNIWGRQCLRLSDIDFKAASHDGVGVDWPITYADLAPYYDLVEDYVGVSAMPEGLAELPDGHFLPPMALTCAEVGVRTAGRASTAASRTRTSTPRSRPWPMPWRRGAARW
jgi:choline dehydrogenase-like flavoprotein